MNSVKTYVENGSGHVFLAVSYNKKRFYVYTGLTSTEKFTGTQFPKSQSNHRIKSIKLSTLIARVDEYMLLNEGIPFDKLKNNIKAIVTGNDVCDKTFIHYIDDFVRGKDKQSTKLVYLTTRKRIYDYDKSATFDSITKQWLNEFYAHEIGRGRKVNGVAIDLRNIRTVFNWAIDNDITTKYPFRKYSIKQEKVRDFTMSAAQLVELRDYPVEPQQERYRDLFMLSFYLIGINISDLLQLKEINNGRIVYRRNKTGRIYDIKVEPEALNIIRKYRGKDHLLCILDGSKNEYKDIRKFNSLMNEGLKRIGRKEEARNARGRKFMKLVEPLFPQIETYTARRTWATIASKLDIPKDVIGKGLGHSEWFSSTTDIYIDFDSSKIDKANRLVLDELR